jgi:hypothetical protein
MGGYIAIKRLLDGALPTRALTDRGPVVDLLPAQSPVEQRWPW